MTISNSHYRLNNQQKKLTFIHPCCYNHEWKFDHLQNKVFTRSNSKDFFTNIIPSTTYNFHINKSMRDCLKANSLES